MAEVVSKTKIPRDLGGERVPSGIAGELMRSVGVSVRQAEEAFRQLGKAAESARKRIASRKEEGTDGDEGSV